MEPKWISMEDQKPEAGRELYYFFEVLGVYKGKYERNAYPVEFGVDENGDPYYSDCFYGEKGFLGDDVTHWQYAYDAEEGFMPDVPEDYVMIYDGHFSGYSHKDNTILVRKDSYESMRETLDYHRNGHIGNLVCQDGCPCHIYWYEEDEGYKCGGCGIVYPTADVENSPNDYRGSTFKFDKED
jgi:hypothetical protein